MDIKKLINEALKAQKMAYAPYSKFRVGAAIYTSDGYVYTGCNIENASYGATNCAERTAIFKAVSEGHRKISAIVIVGDCSDNYTYPCGICRQVISEFADENIKIILAKNEDDYITYTMEEILPKAFLKKDLDV